MRNAMRTFFISLEMAIKAVKVISLGDSLWYCNAKFLCPFDVAGLSFTDEGNDPLTAPENIVYPPVKCGLTVESCNLGIFCGLYWMGFLKVFEVNPRSGAVAP